MPLIQSKSKKAFGENVATEMRAGKPHDQSLAISYSVKRKNARKKMAWGGATENNPSTSVSDKFNKTDENKDIEMLDAEHAHDKPKMAKGGEIKHAHDCMCGGGYCMAGGGEINFHDEKRADADDAKDSREFEMYAEGGTISAKSEKRPMPDDEYNDKASAMRQNKEKGMTSDWIDAKSAHEAEGSMSRKQRGPEWDTDKEQTAGSGNSDLGLDMYADGGEIEDHYDSIADAIMAKRRHKKMMAEGGEVDLEANSEEDPNFEDQQSFKANGQEQYDLRQLDKQPKDSNMHSVMLDSDEHDMVSRIRAKMKAKRGME